MLSNKHHQHFSYDKTLINEHFANPCLAVRPYFKDLGLAAWPAFVKEKRAVFQFHK